MAVQNSRLQSQEVKTVRFLPQDAGLEPLHPAALPLSPGISTVLSHLFGRTSDGGRLIDATLWNALKVTGYGAGYTQYESITDAAPAAYSSADQLTGNPYIQKVDIYAPSADLLIRFQSITNASWGDDIYVPKGFMSIEFVASAVQIKLASATASDYHMTAFS
jgi:hypothetical protein